MQNQENRQGIISFAELETGGRRVECPRCHAPFKPHLGNLITARFQCENCKGNLSFRSITGRQVRCPCCSYSRPMPSLRALVCGGCDATVIYQKDDRAVKCFLCKHITNPPELNYVDPQVNRAVPPQINRVIPPQVNRVVRPQVNRIIPSQVNRVVPPQVNWIFPPQVNRVVPSHVNRVIPPQVNRNAPLQVNRIIPPQVNRMNRTATAETDSTASSSSAVRSVALRIGTIKREVEEDKTEAKSKKIRL